MCRVAACAASVFEFSSASSVLFVPLLQHFAAIVFVPFCISEMLHVACQTNTAASVWSVCKCFLNLRWALGHQKQRRISKTAKCVNKWMNSSSVNVMTTKWFSFSYVLSKLHIFSNPCCRVKFTKPAWNVFHITYESTNVLWNYKIIIFLNQVLFSNFFFFFNTQGVFN